MRAIRCHELVGPSGLRVDELPEPTPGAGEVSIDVRAAGVNFPDILITQGKYQFKPSPPFIPGGEVAGVVRAVGAGVTSCAPGDRVAAFMLFGAFAEQVVVPQVAVVKLPPEVDFTVGATTILTYGTTMHALIDRAALQPKETLLVLGAAGGVGIAAVDIGRCLGARVIAAASSAEKLAFCKAHGASEGIDYSREDLKTRAKALASDGVDVVYDPVGGDLSEQALRTLGWGGRHLVVGFASGTIPKIPINLTLLKSCQIVGVFWGMFSAREPAKNRAHIERVLAWIVEGRLTPVVDATFSFDHAGEALERIAARKVLGKLALVP